MKKEEVKEGIFDLAKELKKDIIEDTMSGGPGWGLTITVYEREYEQGNEYIVTQDQLAPHLFINEIGHISLPRHTANSDDYEDEEYIYEERNDFRHLIEFGTEQILDKIK